VSRTNSVASSSKSRLFLRLFRSFQVDPASLIWPQVLITSTVLNTLHAEDEGNDGRMPRLKFFFLFIGAGFAYYFLPGFLFGALGFFSWVCWIKPSKFSLRILAARLPELTCLSSNALRRHRDQPAFRNRYRSRNESLHLRLESDQLARISSRHSLVG